MNRSYEKPAIIDTMPVKIPITPEEMVGTHHTVFIYTPHGYEAIRVEHER